MRSSLYHLFLCLSLVSPTTIAAPPPLPAGLGGAASDEPSLPSGLGTNEPMLPMGLSEEPADETAENEIKELVLPFDVNGFIEARGGQRVHDQSTQDDTSIGEARIQLQAEKYWNGIQARITTDFIKDTVTEDDNINIDNGSGWIDLREAFLSSRVSDSMDLKLGRQILTWGTGDLLFLNDLFPKDYQAFFIGRDEEYLKAPSDAIKTAFFTDVFNLDVIYNPRFDGDRYVNGSRITTYDPFSGGQTSEDNPLPVQERDDTFNDDEWALRAYKNIGTYETALYGYDGYWKSPNGIDISTSSAFFPRLSVWGASIRGPIAKGIGNTEIAWYESHEDSNGTDPLIPNSQFRFLAGYEQELASELTGGFQYYVEKTEDYSELKANAPTGSPIPRKYRQVISLRLTKLLMNQNLMLSVFNFWSPSDNDGYLRPKATYKINDNWTAETGGNYFYGEEHSTFFGQLEDNTNIYVSLRRSF